MTRGQLNPYAENKPIKQVILAMSTHSKRLLRQLPGNRKGFNRELKLTQQSTHWRTGVLSDLAGLLKSLSLSIYKVVEPGRGVLYRAAQALKTRIAFPIVRSIREDDMVAAASSLVVIAGLALVTCFLLRLL